MLEIAQQKRVAGAITLINTSTNRGLVLPTGGEYSIEFRSTDLIGITFAAPAVGTAVVFSIYVVAGDPVLAARSIRAA